MNAGGQLGVIAAISFIAAGGTLWIKGPPNRSFRCDSATLKPDEICLDAISRGGDVVWVDARSRADWEKNGKAGSLLWNLDPLENIQAFEAALAARIVETPRVIVYCGDENCGISRQIAACIRGLDLGAEVSVLRGGWRALSEADRLQRESPRP
jgi:rhodanese-related sulfurtransferase